jgi:predicted permease
MGTLKQDLRHGLRLLAKSPGFTVAAVLVLALGIGANTAIFSVVNAVLLEPLPYPESNRLVAVFHTPPAHAFPGFTKFSVSPGNFFDWERQNTTLSAMSIIHFGTLNLTGRGDPEALVAGRVSKDFSTVLKQKPMLGRGITPEEAEGQRKVALLSWATWRTRFGGDESIVGKDVQLDGEPYHVVGVLDRRDVLLDGVQLWVPMTWTPKEKAVRGMHDGFVIGRLKPGVTLAAADAELKVLSDRMAKDFPEDDTGWGAVVFPLRDELVGDVRTTLLVLLGAVALVLLIGCANVANLVLARTLARRKEIAVRTALGASRARLVQQLVVETVVLSVVGGVVGIAFAKAGMVGIVAYLGDRLPRAGEVGMSAPVFLFALVLAMGAGLLAGIAPAWRATKRDVATSLKEGLGRTDADATGGRTRGLLVGFEVAVSVVLLVAAGLLVRSLWLLSKVDPGFEPKNLVTMLLTLPEAKYKEPERQVQMFRDALERFRAIPGVESVGGADTLPLQGGGNWPVQIEGRPQQPLAQQPNIAGNLVLGDYFRTLRIPLRKGRVFTEQDRLDAPAVAVISESMAKKFWPGEDPIGKRFVIAFFPDKVREVVGVVGDVKKRGLQLLEAVPTMYFPLAQIPRGRMSFAIRTSSVETVTPAAVAAIHQLDPAQPVARVQTMQKIVDDSLAQQRSTMWLLGGFATLAVVLAAIGIYSVLSYLVRRRGREIGIRIALGAQPKDVLKLVVGQGMRPVLVGIAGGVAAALVFGRLLSSLVFGVAPTDPLTFASVAGLLGFIALVACFVPARQATRIGGVQALREE